MQRMQLVEPPLTELGTMTLEQLRILTAMQANERVDPCDGR